MADQAPPDVTNGVRAAVLEWIRSLDLELISILLARSWPISLLTTREPHWRPMTVRDTDNVDRLDRRQRLIRWDRRPPNEIFLEGFVPHVTREFPEWEETDLYGFARNNHPSIFVSTTKTQRDKKKYVWTPRSSSRGIVYQYEIYAPGGVDVNESFLAESPWPNQMEVTFPGGIQNIYIRSAREQHNGRVQRIWINPNFLDPEGLDPIVSSSTTPNIMWRKDHPDGGNKDPNIRSKRAPNSEDNLMYGGAGSVEEDTFGNESSNFKILPDGEFTIENTEFTSFVLDLSENKLRAIIHTHVYSGGDNQLWLLSYDEDKKAYKVKSKQNPNLLLTWDSSEISKKMVPFGTIENNKRDQYWRIEQTNQNYRIKNLKNLDMMLTALDRNNSLGGKDLTINTSNEQSFQEWKIKLVSFQPIIDGDYYIFNSDMINTVLDFSKQENFLVHAHNFMDYENQKWNFTYDSDTRAYKIRNGQNSSLLLTWNTSAIEIPVQANTENGSRNQCWRIERINNDSYRLRNLENVSNILMSSTETNSYGGLRLFIKYFDGVTILYPNWRIKSIFYQFIPDGEYNIFNYNFQNILIDYTDRKDALVHGHDYSGRTNQKWTFIFDDTKKAYKIKNGEHSDLLLTWDKGSTSGENMLRAYTDNGSLNQYWRVELTSDGTYMFKNICDYDRIISLTGNDSPYGGKTLIMSLTKESKNNNWYVKRTTELAVPNGKYRIAIKSNYKKVIDSNNRNSNLMIIDNMNLKTSEWNIQYDSSYNAYNIYSADTNNFGWIYQNKNYFVKLDNIDGPDHGDSRYFWKIEYSMQNGCYLIRSLFHLSHAVGFTDNNSVITDTSTYSDRQLFHFIQI